MSAVLTVPELLRTVLECSDKHTCVTGLTVCKLWSEICLDILWYEVNSFRQLAMPLGTVVVMLGSSVFQNRPKLDRWIRYKSHYCSRVRILRLRGDEQKRWRFVLDTIARIMPSQPIFPRLHTLRWHEFDNFNFCDYVFMFMSESVRSFIVVNHGDFLKESLEDLEDFNDTVLDRMPAIIHLQLGFAPNEGFQQPITRLLRSLPALLSVSLPPFRDSSFVLSRIAGLPKLTSVQIRDFVENQRIHYCVHLEEHISFFMPAGFSPFTTLTNLEISARYSIVSKFLQHAPGLTHLAVWTNLVERPAEIECLVTNIVAYCTQISSVHIRFSTDPTYFLYEIIKAYPDAEDLIEFSHFQDILQCRKVTSFEISHPYPLNMSFHDIEVIASHWNTGLRTILLNENASPVVNVEPLLTLDALNLFARYCPHIEKIGLLLNTQTPLKEPTSADELVPVMDRMRALEVGASPLAYSAKEDVAVFLSYLLPATCEINWEDVGYDMDLDDDDDDNWEFVKTSLPMFVRVRKETVRRLAL